MADTIAPARRSENMRRIRSKGMEPELRIRRLLFLLGYRYRLHGKTLPGRPDIVFPSRRKVVFVHGCFWHQHKNDSCRITRLPKSNLAYWLPKLRRNVDRDAAHQVELKKSGWKSLVIWECELDDIDSVTKKLKRFMSR